MSNGVYKAQPRASSGQFLSVKVLTNAEKQAVFRKKMAFTQQKAVQNLKDLTRHINNWKDINKRTDFKRYYSPTDNIYSDNPSGRDTIRPDLQALQMCMDHRLGWGQKVTRGLARAAIRNRMEFVDVLTDKVILDQEVDDIKRWTLKSGFWNAFEDCLAFERCYGTAFLVYYWSKNDDFTKPPPKNKPPTSFQAFPPTVLYPMNITETGLLDYDVDVWNFSGGIFSQSEIHRDRVFVLNTRPVSFDWLGLSIFEPIWLPTMAYFQVVQAGVKNISKWGEMIPIFRMSQDAPTREMYTEYLELVEEFRQNYTFILGQSDGLEFQKTELGKGLTEFTEFIKEDIVSGTGVTLNWLFGRATTGGVGGAGALTAERAVIATIANIQHDISQPLWKIFGRWFNVKEITPQFQLDLQKTKGSRLIEEQMELQNEILEEQLKMLKMQRKVLRDQIAAGLHLQEEGWSGTLASGTGEKPSSSSGGKDFSPIEIFDREKRRRKRAITLSTLKDVTVFPVAKWYLNE